MICKRCHARLIVPVLCLAVLAGAAWSRPVLPDRLGDAGDPHGRTPIMGSMSELPVAVTGSDDGPSAPAQPYVITTGKSLAESIKDLQSGNKTKNLVSGDGIGCRVFIQHESNVTNNPAEVHDGADDVFIIEEGTATFILGGKLDAPTQAQPGEWRAAKINGGSEVKASKGDMIVVPRGTPHQRATPGQSVTLMIIKSFAAAAK